MNKIIIEKIIKEFDLPEDILNDVIQDIMVWELTHTYKLTKREICHIVADYSLNEEALKENLPVENSFKEVYNNLLRGEILEMLNTLPEKEAQCIIFYFGLEGGESHTYEQISLLLGISRNKVSNYLHSGLRKLQHPSRKKRLKDFWE